MNENLVPEVSLVDGTDGPKGALVRRVVIDDLRSHRGPAIHLRNSTEALDWLRQHEDAHIDELWLDHDLGGDDTIRPVVHYLEERCFVGTPLSINTIYVHSANPVGGSWVMSSRLLHEHYRVLRSDLACFVA